MSPRKDFVVRKPVDGLWVEICWGRCRTLKQAIKRALSLGSDARIDHRGRATLDWDHKAGRFHVHQGSCEQTAREAESIVQGLRKAAEQAQRSAA